MLNSKFAVVGLITQNIFGPFRLLNTFGQLKNHHQLNFINYFELPFFYYSTVLKVNDLPPILVYP